MKVQATLWPYSWCASSYFKVAARPSLSIRHSWESADTFRRRSEQCAFCVGPCNVSNKRLPYKCQDLIAAAVESAWQDSPIVLCLSFKGNPEIFLRSAPRTCSSLISTSGCSVRKASYYAACVICSVSWLSICTKLEVTGTRVSSLSHDPPKHFSKDMRKSIGRFPSEQPEGMSWWQ